MTHYICHIEGMIISLKIIYWAFWRIISEISSNSSWFIIKNLENGRFIGMGGEDVSEAKDG